MHIVHYKRFLFLLFYSMNNNLVQLSIRQYIRCQYIRLEFWNLFFQIQYLVNLWKRLLSACAKDFVHTKLYYYFHFFLIQFYIGPTLMKEHTRIFGKFSSFTGGGIRQVPLLCIVLGMNGHLSRTTDIPLASRKDFTFTWKNLEY
jgi:hypothetical protein